MLLLEEESSQLQAQLDKLDRARRLTYEEAEEERARRIELEGKLLEAQEQLAEMDQQRKKQEKRWRAEKEAEERRKLDAKRTEEHLSELTGLQSAYAKLSAQLEHDEHKHRKDLDSLTSQVAAFKRSSGEAQSLIKQLEQKNADLRVRLERSAKAIGRASSAPPRPQSQSQVAAVSLVPPLPGRQRPRDARSAPSSSSPAKDDASVMTEHTSYTAQTAQTAQLSMHSGRSGHSTLSARRTNHKQLSIDWLMQRVDDLTAARYAKLEVSKLVTSCRAAEKEKGDLQAELARVQAQQRDGQAVLTKQMREVEGRLDKLAQLSKQYKAEAASEKDAMRRQATLGKLADTERALRNHLEHRTELSHRLANGVLGPDALSRMQDIRDELETLDTEISLNEVRLAEEKRRIRKAGGTPADDSVEQVLLREMEDLQPAEPGRGLYSTLSQMAQALVETKFRAGVDSAAVQALQTKLDDQQGESDELMQAMQKARGDALRKAEQQRLEYEDKIAFLLQQLRASEARLIDTSSSLRKSQAEAIRGMVDGARPLPRPSSAASGTAMTASMSLSVSASTASNSGWRKSDAQLSQYVSRLADDMDADDMEAVECQREIVRRWQDEKERRVALERLVKELRQANKA